MTPHPAPPARPRCLLASLHDVSPLYEGEADRLRDLLADHVDPARIAMLVIPDHWKQAPIRPGSCFATRLRQWSDQGNEIFLHGWCHVDQTCHRALADRLRAHLLTAREGEFSGIDKAEALRLLRNGRALLEDITGRAVAGFIAPAWLYGSGASEAIAELGFAICEDHFRVWQPGSGRTLARGPVVTWASRSWSRAQSSVGFAALARHALNRSDAVRVALHPGDLTRRELRKSIAATLGHFAQGRTAIRYADLLARQAGPAPAQAWQAT
jgi:predicted deacetylase